MQKLHLVGFTTDQDGLILSARRGARSGGYTLVLDDALARAVEELRTRQDEADEEGAGGRDRVESRLPVSEIQARLRRGRSLKDVAKDAGVELDWVERFAAPVFAEQAQVISRVRNTALRRARLGPSGLRIGDAIRRNLVERGVVMSPDEFNAAWTTHQRADGRWIVRFSFHYRGANKTLRFDVAEPNGDPVAADSLTSQLAYVTPPPQRATPRPKPAKAESDAEAATAKRAVVSVGFRPDPPAKAVSRPARERERAAKEMNKAAARRAVEAERAAARKARERSQLLARREREERAEEQRRAREQATRVREAAVAARISAAEQAERERDAAKAAAGRQAEREAARRAARQKVKSGTAGKAGGGSRSGTAATKASAGSRSAPSKASATRKDTPAKAAPTQRTSPKPAPRPAPAAAKERRPSAPPRPEARVYAVAPPPARRRSPAERPERPAPKAPAPRATAAPRPERRAPEPRAEPRAAAPRGEAPGEAPVEPTSARSGLSGTAVDVYGPEATRALFRAGLVEQARGGGGGDADPDTQAVPTQEAQSDNGSDRVPRKRPPGLRRTRPLRAN